MEIDPRLREAAETGNIPFIDTPLHIAANEGQIHFAREMMNFMPSFSRKLNQDGFSPMHLALRSGQTKLVLGLLKIDKDQVRVKGTEGSTPFHCVVIMGNSNLLAEFLEACPECIEDVTVRDDTALHLALKEDKIEAFTLLIGWIQSSCHTDRIFAFEKQMVNWTDDDGNTVLHIAAMKECHEALKVLADSQLWFHVKAKNSEGLTALEIMQKVERQGMNINMSDEDCDTKVKHLKEKVGVYERILVVGARTKNSMSVDMINTMLVVTALVITAIYQSSLSPPGGVWQGDDNSDSSRKAGHVIMSSWWYFLFWGLNLITFYMSFALTIFLLSTFRLFIFPALPLYLLVISYFCSMTISAPSTDWSYINLSFVTIFELLPVGLFVALFFFSKYMSLTNTEIKYRVELRRVLRMDDNVPRALVFYSLFYSQYVLASFFSFARGFSLL